MTATTTGYSCALCVSRAAASRRWQSIGHNFLRHYERRKLLASAVWAGCCWWFGCLAGALEVLSTAARLELLGTASAADGWAGRDDATFLGASGLKVPKRIGNGRVGQLQQRVEAA